MWQAFRCTACFPKAALEEEISNDKTVTGPSQVWTEPSRGPRSSCKGEGQAGSTLQLLSKEILRQKVITYSCFINTHRHSSPLNTAHHFTSINSKEVPFAARILPDAGGRGSSCRGQLAVQPAAAVVTDLNRGEHCPPGPWGRYFDHFWVLLNF